MLEPGHNGQSWHSGAINMIPCKNPHPFSSALAVSTKRKDKICIGHIHGVYSHTHRSWEFLIQKTRTSLIIVRLHFLSRVWHVPRRLDAEYRWRAKTKTSKKTQLTNASSTFSSNLNMKSVVGPTNLSFILTSSNPPNSRSHNQDYSQQIHHFARPMTTKGSCIILFSHTASF